MYHFEDSSVNKGQCSLVPFMSDTTDDDTGSVAFLFFFFFFLMIMSLN